jgi:hypothetical protein
LDLHNDNVGDYAFLLQPGKLLNVNTNAGAYFIVEESGDALLSGTLMTSKGTYVRTTGASGTAMVEYSDRTTTPQVEDVGEGQLTNGRAYVTIDARLADTIDRRVAYHVFVTPEGDCKGLYVTQKSPTGFVVRELQAGRSSLAFEYRIVAKPLGENGTRLALAPPEPRRADDGFTAGAASRRAMPTPLSPEARMEQRVGAQAYAEATAAIRHRLSPLR